METVNVKLNIEITTHEDVEEHPFVVVSVNGYPKFGEHCAEDTEVEFDLQLQDGENYVLSVQYHNKDIARDVWVEDDGTLVKDKRVQLKTIAFDDIELDWFQLQDPSVIQYITSDPDGEDSTGFTATKLSWNGTTTLKFTAPIYIWLLENL